MKIAVVYKWGRDPESAVVRSDGSVDWRGAKMVALEDDPTALAVAKNIASGANADIVGVCIGDGDASWILARGVKETFSVADAPNLDDQALVAKILAAAIKKIGDVDVVVIGDCAAYPMVAGCLAGELGFSAVGSVISASATADSIVATRHIGNEEQTITVKTPAVLGVVAQTEEKNAPGMKDMLMARKKPINNVASAELGVELKDRFVSLKLSVPETKHTTLFNEDAQSAAKKLVDALKKEGVLL